MRGRKLQVLAVLYVNVPRNRSNEGIGIVIGMLCGWLGYRDKFTWSIIPSVAPGLVVGSCKVQGENLGMAVFLRLRQQLLSKFPSGLPETSPPV
jgi:hypothetical protein